MLVAALSAGVGAATPVLLASLGEILTESAGVLNLGLEGIMLTGCVVSFLTTVVTSSRWLGLITAAGACSLLGFFHALLTVSLKSNQIVAGLAMVVFGTGLSSYLGRPYIGMPVPDSFAKAGIPVLRDVPIIGEILFTHDSLTYSTLLMVPLLWFWIFRSRWGLHLRAVGEDPATADSLGVNVILTRYVYTIVGATFAGIAGTYLSLCYTPSWIDFMTAGRGWIAIAVVVFGTWNPLKAFWGAYLYGVVHALTYRLQILRVGIPAEFINMLPYIVPILVLSLVGCTSRHVIGPKSLGCPYDREAR